MIGRVELFVFKLSGHAWVLSIWGCMYYVMDLLHVTTYYEEFFDRYGIAYCMS
jgi:hypothetical protein